MVKSHIVEMGRKGNRVRVVCPEWMIMESPTDCFRRLCGVLAIVAAAPLELHLVTEISDGEDGTSGLISFCSRDPASILIPDHLFIRSRGYEVDRRLARANAVDWNERSDLLVWRGSTNGVGSISKHHLSVDDSELIPRVRLCLALKDAPGTDVKLSAIVQSNNNAIDRDRLVRAGIIGEFVSPIAWHGFKFAIDIDGNSNAWSNFFTRLIMGCCVLKVASAPGYRQWYYGEIEPWTHYVPVKADLSDLHDRLAWCRANLAECGRIAAKGQEFAMAHDFDTEVASAIRRVCEARASGRLRTKVS
jgi:Glycosyl transferase family 90